MRRYTICIVTLSVSGLAEELCGGALPYLEVSHKTCKVIYLSWQVDSCNLRYFHSMCIGFARIDEGLLSIKPGSLCKEDGNVAS